MQKTEARTIFNYLTAYLSEDAVIMFNGHSFLILLSNENKNEIHILGTEILQLF
jgi:hypothetical protein